MIATVKFNLLPTGVENITKEWVEKNHEDFVSINEESTTLFDKIF